MCQFIGHAIFLQVRNVVTGVIDAPFFEVPAENLAMVACLPKRIRDACNEGQQTRQN